METTQELQHWGIKGQKWGVRRYQNADGTLTEEGKAHYMTAARKGKLDFKKLPDEDLDRINKRFEKENKYQQNVEKYQKGTMSYKVKEAVINRIKGNGGGGGGKKGGKGGGGIKSLLLTPITKAFTDAFNYQPAKAGGNKNGNNKEESESNEPVELYAKKGKVFFGSKVSLGSLVSKYTQENSANGERFLSRYLSDTSKPDDRVRWVGSSEEALRTRYHEKHDTEDWTTRTTRNALENTSNKRKKKAKHSDDEGITFVVIHEGSNELTHHGIKGQKWGVRRFQNEDRTWTAAGKERYGDNDGSSGSSKKEQKKEAKEMNSLMKSAKKGFRPGNYSEKQKLYKSDKIKNLADDDDLKAKSKKATDLQNKMYKLMNDSEELDRKLGVYGDDLDGWDPKTGKANYGIDQKQFNAVMKARSDYKKAKDEFKKASDEYDQASKARSESFVKNYLDKPYSKVKVKENTIEEYTHYINNVLKGYLDEENNN